MKKLLRFIENENYRKWLEEHSDLLWEKQYLHLIFTAPIDISEKLKLLNEYEAEARKDKYASEYFDAARNYLKTAVRALNRQDSRVLFQLTEKRRCKNGEIETWTAPYPSYQCILDCFAEDYGEIGEESDFEDWWNVVEQYTLRDGRYELDTEFLMSNSGSVWKADFLNNTIYGDINIARERMKLDFDLNLPSPFKPGDLIYIDCRPFHKPQYAVVIYSDDEFNNDCCSPGCLYYENGELNIRSIKHMNGGFENFSALLRAGIVETISSEYSDHFLVDVSKYIKAHPDCTKKIEDMHTVYSPSIEFERRLKNFIRE